MLPGAPFYRLNLYRRTKVAIDPIAGICLLGPAPEARGFARGPEIPVVRNMKTIAAHVALPAKNIRFPLLAHRPSNVKL